MQVPGSRAGQITGAVFLIGLGLLFAMGWFWPGILYLIGTTAIVDGTMKGKPLSGALQGGLFMIGLGVVFTIGFGFLPLLLILLGVGLLLSKGNGMSFMGRDRSEWRAQREAWREQRHAMKDQYREQRRAMKDQIRYGGPGAMPLEKAKNDQLYSDPAAEVDQDAPDDEYTLGDDGELIKIKNDQRRSRSTGGQ